MARRTKSPYERKLERFHKAWQDLLDASLEGQDGPNRQHGQYSCLAGFLRHVVATCFTELHGHGLPRGHDKDRAREALGAAEFHLEQIRAAEWTEHLACIAFHRNYDEEVVQAPRPLPAAMPWGPAQWPKD